MDILKAIRNTSMVQLGKVAPVEREKLLAKREWENPTGSMKDRMARAVISRAEASRRLLPGDTVLEYTGGSTGTSLALVCAARGYRIRIVTSWLMVRCARINNPCQAKTSEPPADAGKAPAKRG